MSRKHGHHKSAPSEDEQAMTQVWHSVVDTLRLLPTVPSKSGDSTLSLHESQTIDDAIEKLDLLISLRKASDTRTGDRMGTGSGSGSGAGAGAGSGPTINIATPGTPSSTFGGMKRKRRPSVSVSPAPPALTTGASFDSNLTPLASPLPHSGGAGRKDKDRSSTPMAMATSRDQHQHQNQIQHQHQHQQNKKDPYADQLPLRVGRRVAFRMPWKEGEEQEWILATIKRCVLGDRTRYEVVDADDETKSWKSTFRTLIPLPDPTAPPHISSHPSQFAHFPKGSIVLGLYPDTTSFYQATVIAAPSPGTGMGPNGPGGKLASGNGRTDAKAKKGKYILMFVDDNDFEWEVDALDVVPFPTQR